VPGFSDASDAETDVELVPEPALTDDVFAPYVVLVPYSTYHVVAVPCGLTLPETVAVVGAVDVTGPVVAVGAVAAAATPAAARTAQTQSTVAETKRMAQCSCPFAQL
jgi:hypothetical protein